jgi:hypothetical protein
MAPCRVDRDATAPSSIGSHETLPREWGVAIIRRSPLMPYQYQLVTLGPGVEQYHRLHDGPIRDAFRELDLDPSTSLAVLGAAERSSLSGKCSIVGLWYGGDSPFPGEPEHRAALKSLMDMGVVIFPLCGDITRFNVEIPEELRIIGGTQWDEARVAGDVLKAFGLTRELRQAFISYKRTDSQGIAKQLAHILFDRGYQIFLDTASVERGLPFQQVLHDSLANTDLVVLLDSPNCLDSVWVHEELSFINQLGLGVLQLVWTQVDPSNPGVRKEKPTPGTEFSVRFPLEGSHFKDPNVLIGVDARLQDDALKAIADRAAQARIRSLGARRMRVLSYLRAEVRRAGLTLNIHPGGAVEILRDGEVVSQAYPVVGLPDALLIYEYERKLANARHDTIVKTELKPYRLIYDGLGIYDDRLLFLNWLNDYTGLKTLRTEHLNSWLVPHEQGPDLPGSERPGT